MDVIIVNNTTHLPLFLEWCQEHHYCPEVVQKFLSMELGTDASLRDNGSLSLNGRYHKNQVNNVVQMFIISQEHA